MAQTLPPLPTIPGGWITEFIDVGWRQFEVTRPREPDRFLESPEVLEASLRDDYMPYWSFLWPAAAPFSKVVTRAPWPKDAEVLDLGSGIGLTGLAMLACGHRVVFSDYDPQSLLLCRHNAVRNGFEDPETVLLDWRTPLDRVYSVITGCDVTYEVRNQDIILRLLDRMLAPEGIAWIGDPGRYHAPKFHRLACETGYEVRVLDGELLEQEGPLSNAFQIVELTRPAEARSTVAGHSA